jgi:colanic acid biosynthesis glycosyl transferase WcaI
VRFLVYGINYRPESVGIAPFTAGLSEGLAGRGHAVTAVTALPYYPAWRIEPPYAGRLGMEEVLGGVRVLRTWLYVPRRVTTAGRILHELSFVLLSALRLARAGRPDLLVVVSPPLLLGLVAAAASRLWRVPFVLHVKDLQPDAASDLGMLGRSLLGRLALRALFAVERFIYRRAALVATLTEGMRRRIVEKGLPEGKVEVLPDWVDGSRFPPLPRSNAFRERHRLGDRFVVLHAGNMGLKQGLEAVLDAAARLRDEPDVVFLLVGDGAARPALERRAEAMRLPNVRFLPLQPEEAVPEMLAAADLCLVVQKASVSDIVMPSKLLTLLGAGRPVVATAREGTEVARAVRESGGGVVVPPEDSVALAEAVLVLRADPARLAAMGEGARRYALSRWGRDAVLPRIGSRLESLAAPRRP